VDNVQPITPHNTATLAPAELRELQGWLMWRFEQDPNDTTGKPLKVPYYADGGKRHGKQGGIDDRGRMTTFAAARDAAAKRGFTGVGLALMPEFGITALDFDNCVNAGD
jgi:putative DNA primase/helicase